MEILHPMIGGVAVPQPRRCKVPAHTLPTMIIINYSNLLTMTTINHTIKSLWKIALTILHQPRLCEVPAHTVPFTDYDYYQS